VNKEIASRKHGANVEYMGHRPEFDYTMGETAGINNQRAVRRQADGGAVNFIDRDAGTSLLPQDAPPQQRPGDAPITQSAKERSRGVRHQRLAAIPRGMDEVGRVLQNDENGLDDLYKGNYGKALAKGGLNTARNLAVGVGAAASGDPTGGYLAYPVLDAAGKIGGAGVSALGQGLGHVTGIEAKAQRQDDIDLYNQHYFGDKAGESRPLEGFDTAREEEILRRGRRARGHAVDIGSERAGLPQYEYQRGGAARNFLGQRLGKGIWTRWWRDAVTEPRALGQIVTPAAQGIGNAAGQAKRSRFGRGVAKYTGMSWLAKKARQIFTPKKEAERVARKKANLEALTMPEAQAAPAAAGDPHASGDPAASRQPSMADLLAPLAAGEQDPHASGEAEEGDLLSQMALLNAQPENAGAPSRRASGDASAPQPGAANRSAGLIQEEPEGAGAARSSSAPEDEMVRLARERQQEGTTRYEDRQLRERLAKETKDKDTFARNYFVGETLGFGQFDKARHNIVPWIRHFKDRDNALGTSEHKRVREKDPAGYERRRQHELERIRKRLRGEEMGPTGRSMLDVAPDMARRMDAEAAVRSGQGNAAARQAGSLDIDFDDINSQFGGGSQPGDAGARGSVPAEEEKDPGPRGSVMAEEEKASQGPAPESQRSSVIDPASERASGVAPGNGPLGGDVAAMRIQELFRRRMAAKSGTLISADRLSAGAPVQAPALVEEEKVPAQVALGLDSSEADASSRMSTATELAVMDPAIREELAADADSSDSESDASTRRAARRALRRPRR
jgi:hypothetical protein